MKVLEHKKTKCYHCGDDCPDNEIQSEEKYFCCNGCKTVYEILNENLLCDYYALESNPGNKIKSETKNEYTFLNEETIVNRLLDFREGTIFKIIFYIPSVHCGSCIWLLENLHKIQPGIIRSSIVFQKKELEIQLDSSKVSLAEIASLLDSLGYPPRITLDGKPVSNKSVDKTLIYKIGIAGFCFGNIMLLSMSEYVSFLNDFTKEFQTFFSYLSLLLSLPVFFYCASDYFVAGWNAIKNKMVNIDLPIAIALLAAFVQSLLEIFSRTGMGYLDSLSGLIFFLLIGKWYQRKTYDALSFDRDYKSYFPLAVTLLKNGKEQFVPLNELQPGDCIIIRNQDVIPADAIIKEGDARIDYSFVTGESTASRKPVGEKIFAGGRQTGESIRLEVIKKVSESYLTQLWNKDRKTRESDSPLTVFTNKVGKYFTVAILAASAGAYLYWYPTDPSIALHAAISVLIIFCPCTLALAIPFCFGNAMNILSINGLYLKNTDVIEKLSNNDSIVFDKTGTITYADKAEVAMSGFLSFEEKQYVKSMVKNSSHPLSRMIAGILQTVPEIPLEIFREDTAKGLYAEANGRQIKIGSASYVGTNPVLKNQENNTQVFVNSNGEVKACYVFKNKYREGVSTIFDSLKKHYHLHLLSGDNDSEKSTLINHFPERNIHFNQSPVNKLDYLQNLAKTHKTIMVGDGLNDAGALLESNCGISVSESSASFSPACDAILNADQLTKLPDFLSYSKACVKTVRLSLLIALLYNCVGLYFACQGILKPLTAAILMPLSSVSIVLFVTVMTKVIAKKYNLSLKHEN